jgi:HSP20 family molecular chaperone IbpA
MNVPVMQAGERFSFLAEQMSKWVEQVLGPEYHRYRPRAVWRPAINLYEDASAFFLVADVAGIEPDSLGLGIDNGKLIVRGLRPALDLPSECEASRMDTTGPVKLHVMEIDYGPFLREIDLREPVDADGIVACYRNGFLWAKIPKKA